MRVIFDSGNARFQRVAAAMARVIRGRSCRRLATAAILFGAAASMPASAQISAEDLARMRQLQPGEFIAKTREGCGVIRKERGPNSKDAIIASVSRDSWEGGCVEGMALGPGRYIPRNDKMEVVGSTEMWHFYGRGLGHAVFTSQVPGIYLGSKNESFTWDGTTYSRNVARVEPLEPKENAIPPRIWYSPKDYAQELSYTLHPACGVEQKACVTEQRPSPTGNYFDGLKHLPCNGSCGSLWMEKAGPLITAFDNFAREHAADVAAVKQALEPTVAGLRREADLARAEKQREAEKQQVAAQAEAQHKRDEAARAEQQFRTSLQTMNPGQLFAKADELNAQGDRVRAREVQRALIGRFPDHQLTIAAARQIAGESGTESTPPDNRGSRIKAASPVANASSTSLRPIWPSDMEPGNIYFVVESGYEQNAPIMVSALSGQEAVARVQAARASDRYLRPTTYQLLAGRECTGPAWGAVVSNAGGPRWGAACANTPAAAIEGALAGCRQQNPQGQLCELEASIVLALSGSTSWNPRISSSGGNGLEGRFGSYNAQTWMTQYTTSPIKSMQQALSGFDKACTDGRPCYKTSSNMGCIHETPHPQIMEKCLDRKLTPAGLSGSIRNRLR